METDLSVGQLGILATMRTLGPQRVNQALSMAEIAEVLLLQKAKDIQQVYERIHSDLQKLAVLGLVEQCYTLHEWRLTTTGETCCLGPVAAKEPRRARSRGRPAQCWHWLGLHW